MNSVTTNRTLTSAIASTTAAAASLTKSLRAKLQLNIVAPTSNTQTRTKRGLKEAITGYQIK